MKVKDIYIKTLTMFRLAFITITLFVLSIGAIAQCNSIDFNQGTQHVSIAGDLSQFSNYSKFIRFSIDSQIANPAAILVLYHSPNGTLYYVPANNHFAYNITNRQGCNCCGQGCTPVTTYTFGAGVSLNAWHSLALSVTGANALTVYLDGNLAALSNPSFDGCCSGNYNYTSLGNVGGATIGFNGLIEEAAIWNSALSGAQLQQMHAAPCSDIASLALTNPQAAADQMRAHLFNGVDPVAGLATEVATGGRLNVRNSIDLLLASCAAAVPGCTDPGACNYDPAATTNDGSCVYGIFSWYLPIDFSNFPEPAVWACSAPAGYYLANNQACVQTVVVMDLLFGIALHLQDISSLIRIVRNL